MINLQELKEKAEAADEHKVPWEIYAQTFPPELCLKLLRIIEVQGSALEWYGHADRWMSREDEIDLRTTTAIFHNTAAVNKNPIYKFTRWAPTGRTRLDKGDLARATLEQVSKILTEQNEGER